MAEVDLMVKGLRLAWIPRLLNPDSCNLKSIPGLEDYDTKYLDPNLPVFYKDILRFFSDIKPTYNSTQGQEKSLFNNRGILIGGKPFFPREWFSKGIFFLIIQDLLNKNGQLLSFQEFQMKYDCRTNFLKCL